MVLNYTMNSSLYMDYDAECLYSYVKRKYNHEVMIHNHDFYEIFLITKGSVKHWVNGEFDNLAEGTLVFIRPDDTHGYYYANPEKRDTEYINLTFSANVAEKLFAYLDGDVDTEAMLNAPMPTKVMLSADEKNTAIALLNRLNIENKNDKKALRLKMKRVLLELFTKFFGKADEPADKKPLWLIKLTEDMSRFENFVGGVGKMCELSGKSREHISRTIKKHLGITAVEFINEFKLNYAANLLRNTNYPIIDICYTIGFDSVGYFYKAFKNKEGITPKQFRKRYSIVHPQ